LIVVGAGPAGSTVAREVAKAGYKVLMVEEHQRVGYPVHCAGKLSVSACESLGLKPKGILNKLHGAIFHAPSCRTLTVKREEAQAYVLDRAVFDNWLAEEAVNAGAVLKTGTRVNGVSISKSAVNLSLTCKGGKEVRLSRIVVGADGANSTIAKLTGLYRHPQQLRYAAQSEVLNVHGINPKFAEVYLGSRFAPGFFGWLIPTSANSARIGVGLKPGLGYTPLKRLSLFMSLHSTLAPRLVGSMVEYSSVHIIPAGGPQMRTVCDGVITVGDAACQVKSTTGGGLYYGMLCAKIAGAAINKVLCNSSNPVPRSMELEEYERGWRACIGAELSFTRAARAFIDSLSDNDIDYLFDILRYNASIMCLISTFADIDFQSRAALKLMPRLLPYMFRRPSLLCRATRYFAELRPGIICSKSGWLGLRSAIMALRS
jgi:geranylgeranyl reductase family protein